MHTVNQMPAGPPIARSAAGMTAKANMERHAVAGRATFTTRAARMPMQMTSWFTLPSKPLTSVGATCSQCHAHEAEADSYSSCMP